MKINQEVIDVIISYLEEKKAAGCHGVVLGLSGGKDSTVVAMLAKKVWGDNVIAVLMPNGRQSDIEDSIGIASQLELNYITVNIENTYQSLLFQIEKQLNGEVLDKAKTNIPPRLRMTTLYAIAQTYGYMVIGTGNFSESFIGWCTKWGDAAYDFNPIARLTCTEVIELGKILAKEFGLDESYIIKAPSDGLTGHSDEDNFGFTYEQLDNYIKGNIDNIPEEVIFNIQAMHKASEHKRNMPSICPFYPYL